MTFEWTAINQSLPANDRTVLVALNTGYVSVGCHTEIGWCWESEYDPKEAAHVTHWSEFPMHPTKSGKYREAIQTLDSAREANSIFTNELAAERETCAQICDAEASIEGIAQRCAAAIRRNRSSDAIN